METPSPFSILAVDDEVASLGFMEISLLQAGFIVHPASSAKDALHLLETRRPDLVLLDVMMPDMDGFEVCNKIKSNSLSEDIPVIFLSGIKDPKEKIRAFEAGAVDYLIKPVEPSELHARVKTHIEFNRKWRHSAQRARTNAVLLQEVFDTIEDAVIISRVLRNQKNEILDFEIAYANRKFSVLTGFEIEELVGTRHSEMPFINDYALPEDCKKSAANGTHSEKETFSQKHSAWLRINISPLENSLIAVFVRDITHYKKLQQERVEHQNEMFRAEKMATLGTLVAGVGHEINNPNNVLSMNIPLLEKIWKDAEPLLLESVSSGKIEKIAGLPAEEMIAETPKIIASIGRASKRIKNIVKLLRDYVRGDQNTHAARPIDINAAIRAASELAMPQIRKATQKIEFLLAPELPLIAGDLQRLEQVFINLLTNAAESLTSQTQKISVISQFIPGDSCVEVFVRDEGAGIPPEVLQRIGDPFLTTKHDRGGTGLGVSISMRIVEEHGGSIRYDSSQGKGTSVTLRFPILPPKEIR